MSAADDAFRATIGEMATRAHYETMRAGREKLQRSAPLWRRVTDGNPCGFCAMVASRGPVYGSERAAGDGNRYHGRCGCSVEPYFGDPNDWEPSAEEARFLEAYRESYYTGIPTDELSDAIEAWLASHPLADELAEALMDWASAKTPAEVGAMLQQVLGGRGTVSGFDAARLDLDRARSAAVNIERLLADFPDIDLDLEVVPIANSKIFAQASAKKDRATGGYSELKLQLSLGKMRKGSKLGESFDRSVKVGHFHVADGVNVDPMEYVITHEFGHLVNYAVPGSTGPVIRVKNDMLAEMGIANEWSKDAYNWHKDQVSKYARTNYDEAIAEAFADVYVNGDKAFELSKRRVAVMVALYKELYP